MIYFKILQVEIQKQRASKGNLSVICGFVAMKVGQIKFAVRTKKKAL